MDEHKIQFHLSKAYLQWARSILRTQIVCPPLEGSEFKFPPNLLFALTSHAYIYSHLSIVAFVNGQLGSLWKKDNKYLKEKFCVVTQISDLLRTDLGELKEGLKELCLALNIKKIHDVNPELWNDLLNVVKQTRDFLVHPKPDPAEFQQIAGEMITNRNFNFPVSTAENVIGYFYDHCLGDRPDWIKENQEYSITRIDAKFSDL